MVANDSVKGCESLVTMNYEQIESQWFRLVTNGSDFQGHLNMDSLCNRLVLFHALQAY
jgi:hypothetical protein